MRSQSPVVDLFTPPSPAARRPEGLWSNVFRRRGAQFGGLWLALSTILAILAPLLANTRPLLVKENNHWGSPAINRLTVTDVSLLGGFAAGIVFYCLRRTIKRPGLAFCVTLAGIIILSLVCIPKRSPELLSEYRKHEATGVYQSVVHAPIAFSPTDRLFSQKYRFLPPGKSHPFGLDENGADVLSAIIHGSRIALSIGFVSTSIALIIGVTIGGLMGFFSGTVDLLGMRFIEMFSAVPTLFLLLMAVAIFGHNLYMMMAIIGLTGWVGYARFIRAEFLKLRQQDFVQAAIAAGLPLRSILFRHMLPNGVGPVLVEASFGVASAILAESTLSFLGLGLVDELSWGQLLKQANDVSGFHWWIAIFPGMAIFLTVYSYNLIGESLRDALDPRLRGT